MKKELHVKKSRRFAGGTLYWTVSCLLVLTMVTTWLVCGMFAKYVTSGKNGNAARVAGSGVVTFDVWEHTAKNVSDVKPDRVYDLVDPLVKSNNYETIPPGYDIPKDPFVRLVLKDAEVDYYLYVRVIKSENFPESVIDIVLDDRWVVEDKAKGIYKYTGYFDAGTDFSGDIPILKDDQIIVSDKYAGQAFSISFEAYLKQVD